MTTWIDNNLPESLNERHEENPTIPLGNAPLPIAQQSDGRRSGARFIPSIINFTTTMARGLLCRFGGTAAGAVLGFTWFHVPEITIEHHDGMV